ncbi:kinase-like protein [Sistotremastrum suecicum HHB10207 ss-3]|uniref:Kinase-like protein n=1 Tax=Sistotremastrum suecicum HHB10207 ss-3 TaxID=1314776 RepID=A0A166EJP6_9AGAM|nr:kinase-like protein [Sistotremastrum suecicum HHB10207 ss-3]
MLYITPANRPQSVVFGNSIWRRSSHTRSSCCRRCDARYLSRHSRIDRREGGSQNKRRRFQRALNIWREVWDRHRGPSKNYFLPFYGSVTLQNWPPWQANGTADKWINEKRQFRDIDFQAFFLKLANGFVLLHEWKPHPIAHGDIRGANILVGDDCEPLIAEFGLATIITEASGMDLTKTNSRGSIRWQAPELLTGKLSTASDVYAFGMLMFELLTGKQPFHNIRGISNIYMPLLRSCWDKDSSKRPTMREVADRLASEITP